MEREAALLGGRLGLQAGWVERLRLRPAPSPARPELCCRHPCRKLTRVMWQEEDFKSIPGRLALSRPGWARGTLSWSPALTERLLFKTTAYREPPGGPQLLCGPQTLTPGLQGASGHFTATSKRHPQGLTKYPKFPQPISPLS